MPLYEYRCDKCNTIVEILQRIGEETPLCKKCNTKLKKIISTTSFILKGDGWAATGYNKKNNKKGNKNVS